MMTLASDLITIEEWRGEQAFKPLAAEWDALAQRSSTNTPFQTLAYQRAWWRHLGRGALHVLAVRRDDALIGIAPLMIEDGRVQFNGSKEETDYLDLLAAPNDAPDVWQAVFDWLFRPEAPAWSVLDLYNVPADSSTRPLVAQHAAARGLPCNESLAEVCPLIALPASFDAYLEQVDGKQRREIQRKLRRALGAEARLEVISDPQMLPAAVDDFLALLQQSTPEKQAWLNPGRASVFHAVAEAALAAGTLELLFVTVEGTRAAALFNFAYNGRFYVYNSGLAPDSFHALSLGVVISAQAIERAIALGAHTFDFLRGNEEYKYRFGAQDSELFRLVVQR